jgi:hypothetical protein
VIEHWAGPQDWNSSDKRGCKMSFSGIYQRTRFHSHVGDLDRTCSHFNPFLANTASAAILSPLLGTSIVSLNARANLRQSVCFLDIVRVIFSIS